MSCFASGVTVVTTTTSDGYVTGITVSSFASLSLNPPLVLICLDLQTLYLQEFNRGSFAVNILKEEQKELSIKFATRNRNEWSGIVYETWETGAPILKGCLANIECDVEASYESGDHLIIVGRVRRLYSPSGGQPLVYFRSAYAKLGKAL